ncbi:MAG: bifunctional 2-keto-4-hydroxyglutarate aldolase/2-keto-3-deoxy-6-phosphogluconate aldolase [Candidatus Izemoplasmatales bacterium]
MSKQAILEKIVSGGVVAVVRAQSEDQAVRIAEACVQGGIAAIEITFTVPGAPAVIAALSARFSAAPLLIGAGTVLDATAADAAIAAGARFLVGPNFAPEVALRAAAADVPYLPGTLTPTEMAAAIAAGCTHLKLFPGSAFGPSYVKAVKGPFPHVEIMPTGGVSLENVGEWIKAGVFAVGVGSELTGPAKTGDYAGVERLAREFVTAVRDARGGRP